MQESYLSASENEAARVSAERTPGSFEPEVVVPQAPPTAADVSAERTPGSLEAPRSAPDIEAKPIRRAPRHLWRAVGATALVTVLLLTISGRVEALAQQLVQRLRAPVEAVALGEAEAETATASADEPAAALTFRSLAYHPDLLYQPYLSGGILGDGSNPAQRLIEPFRDFMRLYEQRQGEDDNFTIRVVNERTNELLELFVLEDERARHEREGQTSWGRIDVLRRQETTRLVNKYAGQGIPRSDVTVKWGRANQVREAREREMPFITHEMRLARYLGLSLLATEVGTVETFNDDRLVSSVGARSRYQLMPYHLRERGIRQYVLRTGSGQRVSVMEEWHPLLTMEHSMLMIKGFANAVGHEIPGISAYHTGPGNIYAVYRTFLTDGSRYLTPESTVMDAYMWAVTEGYPTVSSQTSFRTYSRGYVASAYGALRATEDLPIDASQMFQGERVQLRAGRSIFLSELLRALRADGSPLRWGGVTPDTLSFYEGFRRMNQHIALPKSLDGAVPVTGDIRLVSEAEGAPVRFFLPIGAAEALRRQNLDVIDPASTFRFDADTYTDGVTQETEWDRAYATLVRQSARFFFTPEMRNQLDELAARFAQLAAENPTHYRLAQLEIIRTHRSMWRTQAWERLAEAASSARGHARVPVLPPQTQSPQAPSNLNP